MFESQTITGLFQPDPDAKLRKRFGRIVAWDPETFRNKIDIGAAQPLVDLDVHAGTDALSWEPGHVVVLEGYDAGGQGGWGTWWITGRVIKPGSGNAEAIIEFMRGSLARQISAEIFAARVHYDVIAGEARRTSEEFGDPTTGDPGPAVTGVEISSTGVALVMWSSWNRSYTGTAVSDIDYGVMSIGITGATTRTPSEVEGLRIQAVGADSTAVQFQSLAVSASLANFIVVEGLNEGLHDFGAKYKTYADNSYFSQRSLIVIGL